MPLKSFSFIEIMAMAIITEGDVSSAAVPNRCILGTAALGGVWGKVDPHESVRTIRSALEQGIVAIDTAPAYGDAECFVGEVLKAWTGKMPKISTKAGRLKSYASNEGIYDFSPEGIERSVLNSLKTLNVTFIDLLFLHEPGAMKENQVTGVIRKLEELKRKGYIGSIGIGGNIPAWFNKYVTPDIFDVVMEFNRLDVCCIEALNTSLPEYQAKKMKYYAASPLHMGLLGKRFKWYVNNPPSWLAKKDIEQAIRMHAIAQHHGLSLSSLAHRFLLTVPNIAGIVIGASDRIELDNTLSDFKAGPLSSSLYQDIIDHLSNN